MKAIYSLLLQKTNILLKNYFLIIKINTLQKLLKNNLYQFYKKYDKMMNFIRFLKL